MVSVDLLECAIFVSEVASQAIRAELLAIELPAVLRFVLVVNSLILLLHVEWVVFTELLRAMGVLTLNAIAAEACVNPVLAKLTFVHRSLDEGLWRILFHGIASVLRLDRLDRGKHDLCRLALRHKTVCLNVHALERVDLGWRGLQCWGNKGRQGTLVYGKCRSTSECRACIVHRLLLVVGQMSYACCKRHHVRLWWLSRGLKAQFPASPAIPCTSTRVEGRLGRKEGRWCLVLLQLHTLICLRWE